MKAEFKKERTQHITELLKDSRKVKLTIDKDLIIKDGAHKKHIEKNNEHLDCLLNDDEIDVQIIRVFDDVKIHISLKEDKKC